VSAGRVTTASAVVCDGLTYRFGDHVAVDDVNLQIRHGETFGLLGPNGAGKTTTIRMLTTLLKPASGRRRAYPQPAEAAGQRRIPRPGLGVLRLPVDDHRGHRTQGDRLMGIGQAITMPLFFSSTALYPASAMPGWLQAISKVNPLTYEVEALRCWSAPARASGWTSASWGPRPWPGSPRPPCCSLAWPGKARGSARRTKGERRGTAAAPQLSRTRTGAPRA
jgi:energy-coupling factor transporter ATP-binding protein EcfA2